MHMIYANDYNIIPIGDHCAIAMILKELGIRTYSYPFDWVCCAVSGETNIVHNVHRIITLIDAPVHDVVNDYLGDIMHNDKTHNGVMFPDETGEFETIRLKYIRRFERLQNIIYDKNVYIIVTRNIQINQTDFDNIINIITHLNPHNKVLFISGIEQPCVTHNKYDNVLIYKYILRSFQTV